MALTLSELNERTLARRARLARQRRTINRLFWFAVLTCTILLTLAQNGLTRF